MSPGFYGIYGGGFNMAFLILMIAIMFSLYAQAKVQGTFNKYLKVRSMSGYTGAEVARKILDRNGLYNIPIEMTPGKLTDHYDPSKRVLRLSQEVYNGTSVASLGVAAHEVGHAIQHSKEYAPLTIRNAIVPVVMFSSRFVWVIIFLGLIIASSPLVKVGIILYAAIVAFQIITLPVEFDASNRAMANLEQGILSPQEIAPTKKVLSAAAMTYVAATLVALAQLFRLISMSNRRD
ncbi:putative neutral zinc metallopeptidase [Gottschalkia purinilytica]|uniref:Putative neutral zinc metallopeptidase n=2 Tax=Gottschalkia purinilytica TaxID=1503 RepID=A0A0L0WB77_GOTPU|nr:putative neutral zinc metallopeptidase [Gottschalkia purinilytica]